MSLIITDEILDSAKISKEELQKEIAVILFQKNNLSLGKASEIAGLSREKFQYLLASREISVHYTIADLKQDMESLAQVN